MRLAKTVACVVLTSGLALGGSLLAQNPATPSSTPKNPISTAPEGTGQTCSYTGSRGDGKTTTTSTCPPGGANAVQRFPYPGDASTPPAAAADAPQPADGAKAQSPKSTAQKFPYPGEEKGSGGSVPAAPSPLQDAGSSGSSSAPGRADESSSSSSSSSSAPGDNPFADDSAEKDKDALPAPKRGRKKLPPVAAQSPDEREEEDVRVAAFYQNDGNYRAAYLRATDAVSITETDPEAHFALAEAARKLGKLDEAEKHYKRCLELDPLPKQKKESQRALKEMSGS